MGQCPLLIFATASNVLQIRSIVGQAILVITVGYPKKYFHRLVESHLVRLGSIALDFFTEERQEDHTKPAESIKSTDSSIGLTANGKRCDTEHNSNNEPHPTV